MTELVLTTDIDVLAEVKPEWDEILSDEALGFVAALHKEFNPRRLELLAARDARKTRLDAGELPDFLEETKQVRESEWTVAPIPHDLRDRRVEITGPVDRKMIINALNSGANVFMADFEDANSPTWANNIEGQINLRDAVRRTIAFDSGTKQYKLNEKIATLLVRPRGWHLVEAHVTIDGEPISASLFDFGLYVFHNANAAIERGTAPYFYLPKMESHLEARLWNDVFVRAQQELDVPVGTIRATVLIETILAAFEMHEILWELRDHSAGLNCGRWDYIFSFIKKFRARHDFITPERVSITMDKAFLAAYVDLLIQTCHRRGIHAMGGMAAQIPIKDDPTANDAATKKVEADKLREVRAGHDGTWVAHPGLVGVAKRIFDEHMPGPNQLDRSRDDVNITRDDLLRLPEGVITEKGVRQNINVGILYLAAWLGGSGAVPLYNLMEDAATAEISRTQLWQWIRHGATLDDGRAIDADLYRRIRDEELTTIGDKPHVQTAARIFDDLILANDLADFLTLPAYEELLQQEKS
ncbi:MAG TPA: malate synthase A [Thermoanaerobaculia bacterium]|jgi:malate synthase|nr:malate synthase A [Thermoanaerobaculia bacterium]